MSVDRNSWIEPVENEPESINVLEEHHVELHAIIDRGLAYHQCELFHDQIFQITDLRKRGIPYRESLSGFGEGLPLQCKDQKEKLG